MSMLKSASALALAGFMLAACSGADPSAPSFNASAPTTLARETADLNTSGTSANQLSTTLAPPTFAEVTQLLSTTDAPTTTTSPSTTLAGEARTEAAVVAAFDDFAELRRTCMADFATCDVSTFEGRTEGRLLAYELTRANSLAGTSLAPAYFPVAELDEIDFEIAVLSVCDWLTEDIESSLAGPMSSVQARYENGRWVFFDLTLLEGENPNC